jgi:glucose/arabinose dehydrogenase
MHAAPSHGSHLKVAIMVVALCGGLRLALSAPVQASPLGVGCRAVTIVAGLHLPLDMEFLPTGEILIAERSLGTGPTAHSSIRLVRNGIIQEPPVIVLR